MNTTGYTNQVGTRTFCVDLYELIALTYTQKLRKSKIERMR
jgi:hypothetical protein